MDSDTSARNRVFFVQLIVYEIFFLTIKFFCLFLKRPLLLKRKISTVSFILSKE